MAEPHDPQFRRLSRYERVQRDLQRSRDSRVPTWAYALMLLAMIGALYLIVAVFGGR